MAQSPRAILVEKGFRHPFRPGVPVARGVRQRPKPVPEQEGDARKKDPYSHGIPSEGKGFQLFRILGQTLVYKLPRPGGTTGLWDIDIKR